jgi:hypothetical protein
MSDLRHKSVDELLKCKQETEDYISKLRTQLEGQKTRLTWIENYIFQKTPKEMTFEEIENALGHKVIIK